MNNVLQTILKQKTPVKLAATAGVIIVILGAYGGLFYLDLQDQIKSGRSAQQRLKGEKDSYEARKREYLAYRNELTQLQQEQRELLKALPKKAEIPTFLSNIQEQAELAGLEVVTLTIEGETPQELYIRIPIRIEVRGSYHTITKFFKNISELPRIVNVENLALSTEKTGQEIGGIPRLRARFVAATFRFRDTGNEGG
jgi:type IV pilus assembly protein PilO